jgi:hypothetical protein
MEYGVHHIVAALAAKHKTNTAITVWADTAYRSKANQKFLEKNGFTSRIHRKKPPGHSMPETTRCANALKSKVRRAGIRLGPGARIATNRVVAALIAKRSQLLENPDQGSAALAQALRRSPPEADRAPPSIFPASVGVEFDARKKKTSGQTAGPCEPYSGKVSGRARSP